MSPQKSSSSSQTFVTRLPIFDRDQNIWGYELLLDTWNESSTTIRRFLDDLLTGVQHDLLFNYKNTTEPIKCLVRIPADTVRLLKKTQFANEDIALAVVPEGIAGSNHGISGIKERDALLVLNDDDADMSPDLVDSADIISITLLGKEPQDIVAFRKKFRDFEGLSLASDIETWKDYQGTRALGFKLFQGPFFTKPHTKKKGPSAAKLTKLRLLAKLNEPDIEVCTLADVISTDVSLTYRLLKYINSAQFSLRSEVASIEQAIALLGIDELKLWAQVVTMVEMDDSPKGGELAYTALQRAKFLQELCEVKKGLGPEMGARLFLLGLFSNIDALLSYDMQKALDDMPIDADIKAALCGTLNQYSDWMRLFMQIEYGQWDVARSNLERLGISMAQASTCYLKASKWAGEQIPNM